MLEVIILFFFITVKEPLSKMLNNLKHREKESQKECHYVPPAMPKGYLDSFPCPKFNLSSNLTSFHICICVRIRTVVKPTYTEGEDPVLKR